MVMESRGEREKCRERGREREKEKREGRDGSCLFERELRLVADEPVSADGGGSGRGLCLKETEQSLHYAC